MQPLALPTTHPLFTPRWEQIRRPLAIPTLGRRDLTVLGQRPAGLYEIRLTLIDEQGRHSPMSESVTVDTTIAEWEVVARLVGIPYAVRAAGACFWYKREDWGDYRILGGDANAVRTEDCLRPYIPLSGWSHVDGGFRLAVPAAWPPWSDDFWPKESPTLYAPPAPHIRVQECPNVALETHYRYALQRGMSPASATVLVPAVPGPVDSHAPYTFYRSEAPPQGSDGVYVFSRQQGTMQWHMQRSPDGNGFLWPLAVNEMLVPHFEESYIGPDETPGESWLCELNLAQRDWHRDIIIDKDIITKSPIIAEFDGETNLYDPANHQDAWHFAFYSYPEQGWKLTIDGTTTPAQPNMVDGVPVEQRLAIFAGWQAAMDATFGPGNVIVKERWGMDGPVFEYAGIYAVTDMSTRRVWDFSQCYKPTDARRVEPFLDSNGQPVPQPPAPIAQYVQSAREWVPGWSLKHDRTISTANGGTWRLIQDTTAEGHSRWSSVWLELSQRTNLIGVRIQRAGAMAAWAAMDYRGGGGMETLLQRVGFGVKEGFVEQDHTYGMLVSAAARDTLTDHTPSEIYVRDAQFLATFPIVCEGRQSANWTFENVTASGEQKLESAIITLKNQGTINFINRFTCDTGRCIAAIVDGVAINFQNLFVDQGFPCWFAISGNTFPTIRIEGNKINQWSYKWGAWCHLMELPAGNKGGYATLTTRMLGIQLSPGSPAQSMFCLAGEDAPPVTNDCGGSSAPDFLLNAKSVGHGIPMVVQP